VSDACEALLLAGDPLLDLLLLLVELGLGVRLGVQTLELDLEGELTRLRVERDDLTDRLLDLEQLRVVLLRRLAGELLLVRVFLLTEGTAGQEQGQPEQQGGPAAKTSHR